MINISNPAFITTNTSDECRIFYVSPNIRGTGQDYYIKINLDVK